MLLPLGILASAGGVSAAYELISTAYGTGSSGQISFTSIPAGYKHLQIRGVGVASVDAIYRLTFNNDTGANYASHNVLGEGAAARSQAFTSSTYAMLQGGWYGSGNTYPTSFVTDILDPFSTTKNKTIRTLQGTFQTASVMQVALVSAFWNSTSAVTSVQVKLDTGNFTTATRVSLYGVRG